MFDLSDEPLDDVHQNDAEVDLGDHDVGTVTPRDALALRTVYATLTDAERVRLAQEAASGDQLAQMVLGQLTPCVARTTPQRTTPVDEVLDEDPRGTSATKSPRDRSAATASVRSVHGECGKQS